MLKNSIQFKHVQGEKEINVYLDQGCSFEHLKEFNFQFAKLIAQAEDQQKAEIAAKAEQEKNIATPLVQEDPKPAE